MTASLARFAAPAALAAALALTACQSLIPGATRDPPRLYDVTPKSTFDSKLPGVRSQLIVETPESAAGLTTSRIAVKQKPTTLDYYARAEWTDLAPRMVQTKLIESFENTRKIVGVGREGSGLRSDYILKSELRHFEAQLYDTAKPLVRVVVNVKLVKMPAREIVANRSFERTYTLDSAAIDDIVGGFDEALGAVLKRIVEWTLKEIDARDRGIVRSLPGRGIPVRGRR
ncbi:MAG: membrane integrity-associated transporter subunit PqiC [Rhodospirillaceae bacterium]|nr:membrane integrity-associated transporter subunit PqiC [Rhodospirillaceae bacterium]